MIREPGAREDSGEDDDLDAHEAALADALSEELVADYLVANPDFFLKRPDVLACMMPPERWSDDAVADLQRYMVKSLREELNGLRDCTNDVIETSRANLVIQDRTHAAVVTMLEAADLAALIAFVNDHLGPHLGVDRAAIGIEIRPNGLFATGLRALPPGEIDRILGEGNIVALKRATRDETLLFGDHAAEIRSAALVRLSLAPVAPDGMLAFGATGEGAFHPQQGTELIRFLARIVSLCLKQQLTKQLSPA
ncbi:MAG: DUF484 family protein [Rhodospirillales bacterium]|jgi:hypothetical protein|nr:DUF484 family protein [Rhodospirillales bacterium]